MMEKCNANMNCKHVYYKKPYIISAFQENKTTKKYSKNSMVLV